jgi:uncharacterized DUF497 family protein
VDYEFDPETSAANKVKHGIDFVAAQALWLDEALVEAPAKTEDEPRAHRRPVLVGGLRSTRRQDADHLGPPVQERGGRFL